VARVDTEVHRDLDRFVEFRIGVGAFTSATASSTVRSSLPAKASRAAFVLFPSFAMT
jgi:hypothetical protein